MVDGSGLRYIRTGLKLKPQQPRREQGISVVDGGAGVGGGCNGGGCC